MTAYMCLSEFFEFIPGNFYFFKSITINGAAPTGATDGVLLSELQTECSFGARLKLKIDRKRLRGSLTICKKYEEW